MIQYKFDLPQLKRDLISSVADFISELSHEWPNDLRFRITVFSPLDGLSCPHKKKKKKDLGFWEINKYLENLEKWDGATA